MPNYYCIMCNELILKKHFFPFCQKHHCERFQEKIERIRVPDQLTNEMVLDELLEKYKNLLQKEANEEENSKANCEQIKRFYEIEINEKNRLIECLRKSLTFRVEEQPSPYNSPVSEDIDGETTFVEEEIKEALKKEENEQTIKPKKTKKLLKKKLPKKLPRFR